MKAIASKDGWYSSPSSSASFYRSLFRPDSIWFNELLPARKYFTEGARTLIDQQNGDVSYASYVGWLGYKDNAMDMSVSFKKPVSLSSLTVSTREFHGLEMLPPAVIKVWGGADAAHMKLLSTVHPEQPKSYGPNQQLGVTCTFAKQPITHLRVVAEPVVKLPPWHAKKGQPAWFFVDELLFN